MTDAPSPSDAEYSWSLPAFSKRSKDSVNRAIPRIVFQTIEDRVVTGSHLQDWLRFRAMNPDLDFQVLDRCDRDDYMATSWAGSPVLEAYERAALGVIQADIFRYAILFERGGYYCDINKAINVPLSRFGQQGDQGIVSYESTDSIVFPPVGHNSLIAQPGKLVLQWAFGFVPLHPLLERVLKRIELNQHYFSGKIFENPKLAVLQFSGPGMFTQVFREFAEDCGVAGLFQAGVDFEGQGVFRLSGTVSAEKAKGHYSELRNAPILLDDRA